MDTSTERSRLLEEQTVGPRYGDPDDPLAVVISAGEPPQPDAFKPRRFKKEYETISLSWHNVNVYAKLDAEGCCGRGSRETKQILHNVTGMVPPGKLIAIMGASGAGKSTLINVLTHRNLANLMVEGDILVNGAKVGQGIRSVSAYVQQDDLFISTMRVREQLWFTAMLRMDSDIPTEDRNLRLDMVMQEIGLTKCADSMIGMPGGKKSISGGERKRLAFASEILTDPALLFCDEPTSGLDSYMALSVVQTLKTLASQGKTILCTIHQPSSDIFAQFDDLLLLAEGHVAYMGPSSGALSFFSDVGFLCPPNYNPADHYIHTLAVTPGEEGLALEKIDRIVEANRQSASFQEMEQQIENLLPSDDFQHELEKIAHRSPYKASYWRQFWVVLWRSWVTHFRDPVVFRGRVFQNTGIGLLIGLIYLQQPYDQKGVMNINGALFLMQIGSSMGNIFAVINVFPQEYPIFLREHQNGMYTVLIYFMGKLLAELLTFLILPVVLASIAYWMIGLYPAAYNFGIHVAALVLIANTSISFGYVMSTLSNNVGLILAVAPLLQLPLMLFGGFFLNAGSVPVYLVWLKYISWFNYANEILVVNQWKDVTNITCDAPIAGLSTPSWMPPNYTSLTQPQPGGFCYPDGKAVIKMMSYDEGRVTFDFWILLILLLGFRVLAYIMLTVRTSMKK